MGQADSRFLPILTQAEYSIYETALEENLALQFANKSFEATYRIENAENEKCTITNVIDPVENKATPFMFNIPPDVAYNISLESFVRYDLDSDSALDFENKDALEEYFNLVGPQR